MCLCVKHVSADMRVQNRAIRGKLFYSLLWRFKVEVVYRIGQEPTQRKIYGTGGPRGSGRPLQNEMLVSEVSLHLDSMGCV